MRQLLVFLSHMLQSTGPAVIPEFLAHIGPICNELPESTAKQLDLRIEQGSGGVRRARAFASSGACHAGVHYAQTRRDAPFGLNPAVLAAKQIQPAYDGWEAG